jgi:hypothetical protein
MQQLRVVFEDYFWIRWAAASTLGLTVGLFAASLTLITPVICLNGALAGAVVGLAQWFVLRRDFGMPPRWIGLSALGGALGVLPAVFLVLLMVFGMGMFALVAGALFGAAFGGMQWFALRHYPRADWWILANAGGAALCALLAVTPIISGLPLGLLLGAALYSLITGRALLWITESGVTAS